MAGLFDLIKGLHTGISSGVGAVASAPKKVVQAISSPQGKQVIANLTKIALEKKRKEEEEKAKVQAVIDAQLQAKKLQNQTVSAPSQAPIDVPRSGFASLETRFDPVQQLTKNIGDGYNAVREPLVNTASTALQNLNPITKLLQRLKIQNPIGNEIQGAVSGALKKTFEDPIKTFSDNTLLARNKFQTGNKNLGDVGNVLAGSAANTAGLAMSAIPFIAQFNAGVGALQGNERTKGLGDAADFVGSLPSQGLGALASVLPVSDEVKQALVMAGSLGLAKAGSKVGEGIGKRIDAGNLGRAADVVGKELTGSKATMFSGINPTPFLKGVREFAKNPIVQAIDPTGITTGLGATSKSIPSVDPLIAEAKKYNSVEDFVNAQGISSYHGTYGDFTGKPNTFPIYEGTKKIADVPVTFSTYSKEHAQAFGDKVLDLKLFGSKNIVDAKGAEIKSWGDAYKFLKDDIKRAYNEGKSYIEVKNIYDLNDKTTKRLQTIYVTIKPDNIKTKSQLIDIYNEAKRVINPVKDTKKGSVNIKDVDVSLMSRKQKAEPKTSTVNPIKDTKKVSVDPLIAEAKKYKSAEEFVKAQPKLYHGGSADIKDIQLGKSNFQKTFYMSENADYAKSYGGKNSSLNEIWLDPKAKIADLRKPNSSVITEIEKIISSKPTGKNVRIQKPDGSFIEVPETKGGLQNAVHSTKEIIQGIKDGKAYFTEMPEVKTALKNLGYDGMITQESKFGVNYGVWNKDIVKTKSQLTDIYNKAKNTGGEPPVVQKATPTVDPLIAEAKKYKSAEEFADVKIKEKYGLIGSRNDINKGISTSVETANNNTKRQRNAEQKTINTLAKDGKIKTIKLGDGKLSPLSEKDWDIVRKNTPVAYQEPVSNLDYNKIQSEYSSFIKTYNKAKAGEPPIPPVPPKANASMGGEVKADLPEPIFAGNVKMKNIGSSDDARALINLGAQRLKAEGGDGYKEVVPLEQVKQETKDLSERTGINKTTLEQWAKESVENRVRITAAREAMSSYAEDVAALSMKSRNEPDNLQLKQELADKVRSMQEIQAATSTIIAESGRTLGANRIKTLEGDAIRIQEYIKRNQEKDPGAIADFLQSVPAKDLPEAIKKLTVPSFLDRIMTVRQAALLTDPRTSARNILGNTIGSGLRVVQKPFDILADKIISGFNKTESTRSFSELLPGNKYKKMLAKKEIDQYLEKYANESGKFDNTALKKTFIEKGADKVFQFLEFQDKVFKRMIAKDSIVSSARAKVASEKLTGKAYKARMEELTKNPTDDMLLEMANEATKWTYQNKPNSRVYDTVAGIRNKIPVVGKLAVPFLRTVWNLGSMAIERTVPGQALNLYKLTQGKISGKQALSSLLLTAAIQGAVSAAVESGNVTGTERDPKKRAIREAEGIKDDVINTPFGSFSYKNLEPVSSIIGTAVDVQNAAKGVLSGEKNVVSGVGSVGFSMADRFVNNSFLRGIKDLLDLTPGYQDFSGRNAEERSVNNLGDYGKQQLATFYPRAFNWLEEISNEARSQRPEGFLENIMASTPGLSKGVATKVDIWGKDIKKQDVTGNSAINTVLAALVPIQIEKQRNDPVNKEILRLKYYPSVPTQTIDGVSLSNKEYEKYSREAGTMAKENLDKLIKDPIYQRKSDADKIRAIESTISNSRTEAKKSLGNLLDAGQRENLKGKNAKEVEDAAKKVFKEELSPPPKPKTANEIKSGARTAATTAAKGAQKVESINNMIDAITEQLPQRTEQEILNTIRSKAGGKFSEEEILFAIDMAKTGQKMSTTNPQDATQEYLQKNLPK